MTPLAFSRSTLHKAITLLQYATITCVCRSAANHKAYLGMDWRRRSIDMAHLRFATAHTRDNIARTSAHPATYYLYTHRSMDTRGSTRAPRAACVPSFTRWHFRRAMLQAPLLPRSRHSGHYNPAAAARGATPHRSPRTTLSRCDRYQQHLWDAKHHTTGRHRTPAHVHCGRLFMVRGNNACSSPEHLRLLPLIATTGCWRCASWAYAHHTSIASPASPAEGSRHLTRRCHALPTLRWRRAVARRRATANVTPFRHERVALVAAL